MKVPLSWLRELVDIELPVTDLARRLTMAGFEVEEVHSVGSHWRDVTIARVVELEPHPRNAAWNVARLDLGGRSATIVSGAPNLQVGQVVPYVAPGGRLPSGQVGAKTLGGVVSEGMACSGDELDISPDREGIYVLEPEAPVGLDLAKYLDEVVLDIYITANRPDCMSMTGIAREVHALTGGAYQPAFHAAFAAALPPVSGSAFSIQIDDPVGCPRFSAALVRGLRIGPSPQWLQRRLHFAGVRPISNVVDVTNYVMLELGQPLHAFDRARLASDALVIRRAREGDRLRTLDGEDRVLSSSMMVVADRERARSLAGIMGGQDSEIAESTNEVVLEGANWDRRSIRLTSAALGLISEASRRFGRGVDPDLTAAAVARSAQLTLELAGGELATGLLDQYPGRQSPKWIQVAPPQIDVLLGTQYPSDQVVRVLDDLGFSVNPRGEEFSVGVPGWRRFDVEGRADLAEEVSRVLGYEALPSTTLAGRLPEPRPDGDAGFSDELQARRALAAAGLHEVITYSLVDPALVTQLVAEPRAAVENGLVRVSNPQSAELSVLRNSLLGSLLLTLRTNLRQRQRVLLFELARVWNPGERRHIGLAMAGPRLPAHWSSREDTFDFFDIKGVLDQLCRTLRVPVSYAPGQHPSFHPGRTAEIFSGEQRLGVLGQLHPTVAERLDMAGLPVLVAELDFERLLQAREPLVNVRTPSRFPPADRDIAIVVDESVPHAEAERVIRETGAPLLEHVQLFDVYRGDPIPPGRKSLAFALRYRAPDKTLDDDEVAAAHGRIEAALRAAVDAEVRGR
jgi:phenylalanyl-tRNA synthetase beta chain